MKGALRKNFAGTPTGNRHSTERGSSSNYPEAAASNSALPTDDTPLIKAGQPIQKSTQSLQLSRQDPPIVASDDEQNVPASATTFTQIMHPSHEVRLQPDLSSSCGGTATEAIVGRVCEGPRDLQRALQPSVSLNQS